MFNKVMEEEVILCAALCGRLIPKSFYDIASWTRAPMIVLFATIKAECTSERYINGRI